MLACLLRFYWDSIPIVNNINSRTKHTLFTIWSSWSNKYLDLYIYGYTLHDLKKRTSLNTSSTTTAFQIWRLVHSGIIKLKMTTFFNTFHKMICYDSPSYLSLPYNWDTFILHNDFKTALIKYSSLTLFYIFHPVCVYGWGGGGLGEFA